MNTSIVGHGAVRNGVVQGGAVALMLGAVLAGPANAQADVTVERDRDVRLVQAEAEAARREAQRDAEAARSEAHAAQREAEQIEQKLRAAQERLQEAAQEVAELSQARAQDAMGNWVGVWPGSTRPVLGIQLDPERDGAKDGTRIEDVSPGGPAEQAGVRAGDVITMVNGKDVKKQTTRELLQELRAVDVKKPVKLRVLREGKSMDFDVTARVVSARAFIPPVTAVAPSPPTVPMPLMPNAEAFRDFGRYGFSYNFGGRNELNGLEVTPLTPQLGRYFGTDKGMLVLRAPKGELFKLQEGDVIVSIDGRAPTSGSHISRILSSYQPGEKLTLRILRDRKEQDLAVTLPEDARGASRERQRDRSAGASPAAPLPPDPPRTDDL